MNRLTRNGSYKIKCETIPPKWAVNTNTTWHNLESSNTAQVLHNTPHTQTQFDTCARHLNDYYIGWKKHPTPNCQEHGKEKIKTSSAMAVCHTSTHATKTPFVSLLVICETGYAWVCECVGVCLLGNVNYWFTKVAWFAKGTCSMNGIATRGHDRFDGIARGFAW